ncbi:hypothetical protein Hanom_Chr13g01186071 [Helianthus anomalus]
MSLPEPTCVKSSRVHKHVSTNLHVLNKFMGDKDLPNVIRYYYGKFYRSGEHHNWSIYLSKERIKKSLPGKKILRGWRLQELLPRLLSNVTDECKASLTQVIKMFEEGKLCLRSMYSL